MEIILENCLQLQITLNLESIALPPKVYLVVNGNEKHYGIYKVNHGAGFMLIKLIIQRFRKIKTEDLDTDLKNLSRNRIWHSSFFCVFAEEVEWLCFLSTEVRLR